MKPGKIGTRRFFTLPNLLSALRLGIVPVLFCLAWTGKPLAFLAFFAFLLFTDIADGFIARKLNQESELGAKLDSWGDFAMYMSAPVCAWWLWPDVVRREALFVITAVISYLTPAFFGFLKYGRLTSYHTYGAKISAVLMGSAILILFAGGSAWPFRIFTPLFALTALEEIAMTAILPEWRANIPSLWHAVKIKRNPKF